MSPASQIYAKISGPIVMIGFGSIGRGTLPLIERHFAYDRARMVVIDPDDEDRAILDRHGVRFVHEAVTRDNYRDLLPPLLTKGGGRGICVNLSVDTPHSTSCGSAASSACSISTRSSSRGPASTSTVGGPEARSNYALRETMLAEKKAQSRRVDDGRLVLRRQSRHGLVVRQAGADRPRRQSAPMPPSRRPRAGWAGLCARARRQGHPYRRARHPAGENPESR